VRLAGQIEEGSALLDEALQLVERTGERWFAAELNRHKGQLLLRQGYSEAAEERYRRALSIAEEQEAKLWELRAAVSLARLRRLARPARGSLRHPPMGLLIFGSPSWTHIEPCASLPSRSFGGCSIEPETCRLRHNVIGKRLLLRSCVAVERGGGPGAGRRRSWHKTGPAINSPAALIASSPRPVAPPIQE
jgi:hypothetical protein